mmetsp:Transcript_93414/g.171418  ORF Transcript_93414/g.171418 Transcript_93414/m.171418 type:complete len:236 (-) Transcript_93414:99-806(-)
MVLLLNDLDSPPMQPPRSRKPTAFLQDCGRFKTLLRQSRDDIGSGTSTTGSSSDGLCNCSTLENDDFSGLPPLLLPSPVSSRASADDSCTAMLPAALFRPSSRGGFPALRPAAGEDGYHDMVLPCGLRQEEMIDILYRELTPEDFETLSKLDERVPKRDLAGQNVVDQLPLVRAADCGVTKCGVCLEELEPEASVVKLPCRHAFHPRCISRWLTKCKNTCPLCTAPIQACWNHWL